MPIFEERENLGVKTLKSFAGIKNVCHSEIWQVKFIDGLESHFSIKDSYKLVVYDGEKVGLWCSFASYLSVQ